MEIFDLCIVGSGPSAAALYDKVNRIHPSIRVCILEAGAYGTSVNKSKTALPSENFRLNPTHRIGVGGTSELWHYVLAPLDPIDFEERPYLNAPGWPIRYDSLQKHYDEVLEFLGLPGIEIFDNNLCGEDIEDLNLNELAELFVPKIFVQLKKRWRALEFWTAKSVKIEFNHFVYKIELNSGGLRFYTLDENGNNNAPVFARFGVVAAGGLNTPQVLYNSDIDPFAKSNVGKYLLDHPMGVGMQLRRDRSYNFEMLTSKKEKLLNRKIAFRLREEEQLIRKLPNSSFYFKPSFAEGYSEFTEDLKAKILTYRSDIVSGRLPFRTSIDLLKDWDLVAQVIAYKTGFLNRVSLFDVFCVTEQVRGTSNLSFEQTPEGFYRAQCNWSVDEIDVTLNQSVLRLIADWVWNAPTSGRVTVDPAEIDWSTRCTSAAHHIGSAPMAENSSLGVVDPSCQVFGTNGRLFVADASVMPSAGCANVTLTSMALANRVGEFLNEAL